MGEPMTSKLKCPFCGEELDKDISGEFGCPNEKCKNSMFLIGTEEMWQALIQSQKDLAVTKDFLQKIRMFVHKGNEQELAKIALEQIEHKE